jgi:hypothetical protein
MIYFYDIIYQAALIERNFLRYFNFFYFHLLQSISKKQLVIQKKEASKKGNRVWINSFLF